MGVSVLGFRIKPLLYFTIPEIQWLLNQGTVVRPKAIKMEAPTMMTFIIRGPESLEQFRLPCLRMRTHRRVHRREV